LVVGAAVFLIIRRWGVPQLVNATFIPIVVALVFLLGLHGKDLDLNYSARPLAREIQHLAPNESILAVYQVRRDLDYGLAFYRNNPTVHYTAEDCPASVPAQEHILVIPTKDMAELNQCLVNRVYKPLFLYDTQGLEVYKVYAHQ
ncbi:MAG TPA: glycosyltransferase family 39 protein, partial [Terracidiphilus sp.]|nr:glycosyltransferase family 39 protein [Terracidiphilus sp.]